MTSAPIRLVLVEDDPAACERVAAAVAASDDIVLVAVFHDAESALARLLDERMPADIVLVDLVLPGADGVEVIRRLGAGRADVESVVLTTMEDDRSVFAALEAGATGYLVKAQGVASLREDLGILLRGGSPISPTIARRLVERFRREPAPAPSSARSGADPLTAREREVLARLARGASYGAIARELGIGTGTVQSHIKSLYGKLGIHSRAEALREAYRRRLR
jgi:DNA-binding NarL/FixJ family response regulator